MRVQIMARNFFSGNLRTSFAILCMSVGGQNRCKERAEMNRYQATNQRTDCVFSKNWGFGKIVDQSGKVIKIQFKDKWRQIDFDYYRSKGEITYVVPIRDSVNYLMDRKVKYLVHFTPIENLYGIMKEGILPRDKQTNPGLWPDDLRLDGHTDCSCFSISYPNYRMLYQKRMNRKNQVTDGMERFAILLIDPSALQEIDDNDIAYYQNNAANHNSISEFSEHTGLYALSSMFADNVTDDGRILTRDSQFLSSEFTTHPQAEVLIRGAVPAKYIRKIVLCSKISEKYLPCKIPKRTELEFDKDMFWPTEGGMWADYEMWRRSKSNGYQAGFYCGRFQAVC